MKIGPDPESDGGADGTAVDVSADPDLATSSSVDTVALISACADTCLRTCVRGCACAAGVWSELSRSFRRAFRPFAKVTLLTRHNRRSILDRQWPDINMDHVSSIVRHVLA